MNTEDTVYSHLGRNLLLGFVLAYAGTTALCFIVLGHLSESVAIAAIPAMYAGPYVAILLTVNVALLRSDAPTPSHDAAIDPTDGAPLPT